MNNIRYILCALALAMTASVTMEAANEADKARTIVSAVRARLAPDSRQNIYDITVCPADNGKVVLTGTVSEGYLADSLMRAIAAGGIDASNGIAVLPSDNWALPRISVACLRTRPGHSAEMASQALMGMPLRVLDNEGEWLRVQTPDGYISWVVNNSVAMKTPEQMAEWRRARRLVVTSPYQVRAYRDAKASGMRDVVTDLVCGDIVEGSLDKKSHGRVQITLPDGRTGWCEASALTPIEEWSVQDFNADVILDMAYSMEGTPYLWGGTSPKTLDCSGLAKVSYLANGIILMRDASQQATTGTRIEAADWRQCKAGDLLFFGNPKTGRVTHVAIYDHDGDYVHSSGRVRRNSVNPDSPIYLTTPFLHAVRIDGNIGTRGITAVRNHPWYFDYKK